MAARRWSSVLLAAMVGLVGVAAPSCSSPPPPSEELGTTQAAATVPTGFVDEGVAAGLARPTAMAFAPDGRIFIAQQGGQLRVVKNGALLATPFLSVTTTSAGERGLLGVAFHPSFATNRFVYVYYTVTSPSVHNRVSRFTASATNADVAQSGSETVILELNNLSTATNHNGGAMHFAPDGKLFVAVGENANGSNAQTLGNLLGKMLRINDDGTIPSDNPFFTQATGVNRAIWALGLRNPFTFALQPGTSRMFINDVGQDAFEEIDDGIRGSNYGWPTTEGTTTDPRFRSPLFVYGHGTSPTTGCAITGGAFYNPSTAQFPSSFVGKYFFADFCSNWIRVFDPAPRTAAGFATGLSGPVDLNVGPDGLLYYLQQGGGANTGELRRIRSSTSQAPAITSHPASQTVAAGQQVTFSVTATGSQPLSFQWQRGTTNIAGATGSALSFTATAADNGASFRAVVTNAFGTATSNSATLTVASSTPPTASITAPPSGTTYRAGDTIAYSGTGTDPEDGTLPASAFTWEVVFHHDAHTHPFVLPISGAMSGSFTIPNRGETATNVFYRIHLTVRDSTGLTHSTFRDISPQTSTISLATNPSGLQVTLDGQPVTTPASVSSVVGMIRALGVVSPQSSGGTQFVFASWSDGGAATHEVATPAAATTFTATYTASTGGLTGEYFDNVDFTSLRLTRTDPEINFDFGTGAPAAGVGADTFAIRWTGTITPQFSQAYTLFTTSDDGIRLWFNGARLIDNFTNHGPTENSGVTPVLVAGQAYPIQIDYFENAGGAVAKLSWSSTSQPKQIVPQAQLSPGTPLSFPIRINYQPTTSAVPPGYLMDDGSVFGPRPGSVAFGWNVSHTDVTRERNVQADQLLDTLCHIHAGGIWEIALPYGRYDVRASIGDPGFASTHTLIVENTTYWAATALGANQFLNKSASVLVGDGRLTLSQGGAADKATRINFVEVSRP